MQPRRLTVRHSRPAEKGEFSLPTHLVGKRKTIPASNKDTQMNGKVIYWPQLPQCTALPLALLSPMVQSMEQLHCRSHWAAWCCFTIDWSSSHWTHYSNSQYPKWYLSCRVVNGLYRTAPPQVSLGSSTTCFTKGLIGQHGKMRLQALLGPIQLLIEPKAQLHYRLYWVQ